VTVTANVSADFHKDKYCSLYDSLNGAYTEDRCSVHSKSVLWKVTNLPEKCNLLVFGWRL